VFYIFFSSPIYLSYTCCGLSEKKKKKGSTALVYHM
jgi:hypothetical protein